MKVHTRKSQPNRKKLNYSVQLTPEQVGLILTYASEHQILVTHGSGVGNPSIGGVLILTLQNFFKDSWKP